MTLRQLKQACGIEEEEFNEIALDVFNCTFSELNFSKELTKHEANLIKDAVAKYYSGMPVNKIFNTTYFYGLKLRVNRQVLAPRADTEVLVGEALRLAKPGMELLDLGSGSGAIALAIKSKTDCKMYAADISRRALKLAKYNAKAHNLDIKFIHSDMFKRIYQRFDMIVCNPPYISENEYNELDLSVKKYDPKLALYGGNDGLDYYRYLAQHSLHYLKNGGILLLEIGYRQADAVKQLFCEKGYELIDVIKDIENRDRVVIIKRR